MCPELPCGRSVCCFAFLPPRPAQRDRQLLAAETATWAGLCAGWFGVGRASGRASGCGRLAGLKWWLGLEEGRFNGSCFLYFPLSVEWLGVEMLFSRSGLAVVSRVRSAVAVYLFLTKKSLTDSVLINVEWVGLYAFKAEPRVPLFVVGLGTWSFVPGSYRVKSKRKDWVSREQETSWSSGI